jgi:3'-phosphoadenosine 5'-phosphosulfate sulfotransferase
MSNALNQRSTKMTEEIQKIKQSIREKISWWEQVFYWSPENVKNLNVYQAREEITRVKEIAWLHFKELLKRLKELEKIQ